jgi:hypothetical protein
LDFGLSIRRKFKEEQIMASKKLSEAKFREIQEVAAGWGKLLARESFASGPGLDVTLADMEDIAAVATQALVRGAIEEMTNAQADGLGDEAPCPSCGAMCELKRKGRDVTVRGGSASLEEPVGHCKRCRRDFFPSA